ncbi:hypothetical protein V6N13_012370 [Hibiscus sabdariffa]
MKPNRKPKIDRSRQMATFPLRNTFKLAKNPLELTYGRKRGDKRTVYDGALVFDSGSKVSASYMLGTRNCKLKYSYLHGGVTTLEPCYDLGKNVWDFAISRRLYDNVFKATYQTWSKNLALEWFRNRVFNGTFKFITIYERFFFSKEFGGSELLMSHEHELAGFQQERTERLLRAPTAMGPQS